MKNAIPRIVLLLVAFAALPAHGSGQPPLLPGDTLPPTPLPRAVAGYGTVSPSTGDYADRLLIIDFWATNCSGCIAALPKMDSLQALFPDRIAIIPVTQETGSVVGVFLPRNRFTKGSRLPYAVEDSLLSRRFPHRVLSHVAWIDRGRVVAITGTEYVTRENIETVLSGEVPDWPVKKDMLAHDYGRSLLDVRSADAAPVPSRYVALTPYMEAVETKIGIAVDTVSRTKRGYLVNLPIASAYFVLWMKARSLLDFIRPDIMFTRNQLLLDVPDPDRYIHDPAKHPFYDAWLRRNAVCLELVTADISLTDKEIYGKMIQGLDMLLDVRGRWERQAVTAYVLVPQPGPSPPAMPGQGENLFDPAALVHHLNGRLTDIPVFNGCPVGRTAKFALSDRALDDLDTLKKELGNHGYVLELQEREVDRLVISHPAP